MRPHTIRSLTRLAVVNLRIGDKGAAVLVESCGAHMRLVELNLDRCAAITEEGVQALYRY